LPRRTITIPGGIGGPTKPTRIEVAISPPDVSAYRWEFQHEDGSIQTFRRVGRTGWVPAKTDISLTKTGVYTVTLFEELRGGGSRATRANWRLQDLLIVCLGDSWAAGEGNPLVRGFPTFFGRRMCNNVTTATIALQRLLATNPPTALTQIPMDKRASWVEPLAHRSYDSGHARAVQDFEDPRGSIVCTFLSFATSGAEIEAGMLQPQHSWQRTGQVEEAKAAVGNRNIDALILSIGGNDVGFSTGLSDLASDWHDGGTTNMRRATLQRIEALPTKYESLVASINGDLNPERVFITQYAAALFDKPDPIAPNNGLGMRAKGCGVFDTTRHMAVSAVDAGVIWDLALQLNKKVKAAADNAGWIYVDGIVEGFAGHGYCSDNTFFVGAEQSCNLQGDFNGTMHPNEAGHSVIAQRVGAAMNRAMRPVGSVARPQSRSSSPS
jgi:hypothetical protein